MSVKKTKQKVFSILFLVVGLVFMLNTKTSYHMGTHKMQDVLISQESEIAKLKDDITVLQNNYSTKYSDLLSTKSNINLARVLTDKDKIETIYKDVLSWDSYEKYENIRKKLKEMGMKEDSQFLTSFMPHLENEVLNGRSYNTIDVQKLNSNFDSAYTYLFDVQDDVYYYATFAKFKVKDAFNRPYYNQILFTCKVDKDGNILDMIGYTLPI